MFGRVSGFGISGRDDVADSADYNEDNSQSTNDGDEEGKNLVKATPNISQIGRDGGVVGLGGGK